MHCYQSQSQKCYDKLKMGKIPIIHFQIVRSHFTLKVSKQTHHHHKCTYCNVKLLLICSIQLSKYVTYTNYKNIQSMKVLLFQKHFGWNFYKTTRISNIKKVFANQMFLLIGKAFCKQRIINQRLLNRQVSSVVDKQLKHSKNV